MKEKMGTIIIHILVGLAVFVAALVAFNYRLTAQKENPVAELQNSTYPVLEIGGTDTDYNAMSAYSGDIDLSLVRNQVTVVDNSKTLELKLHNYDYDITAIQYVLFESDPEDPLEEGTLNQLTENEEEGVRTGTITFESNLKQGKNYYLRMSVRLDNSTRVYFYTKIQNGAGYHLDDYFTYVLYFHDSLFDSTNMEDIATYLESSGNTQSSLEYVNINSSSSAVFYGDMEVNQESDPRITVRELNSTYAVLELTTILSTEISDGVVRYYDAKETFKVRYSTERMYLLDYERTMDAYYNESIIDSTNNYVSLGIQDESNVDYMSSDEGKKIAFAVEGQLWYYNYSSSDVSKIYSFSSENLSDLQNNQDEHGIKILSFDDDGNIVYLVYGYISRGKHEGANGIQIMRYSVDTNCNEELAFLVTSVPYDSMKEDIEKLAYLNADNVFYCLLDGDLHKVDLEEKTDEIMKSGLLNDSLTASKDHHIIAIEQDQDVTNNTAIEMIDLESGDSVIFTCKDTKRIRSIGFLDNDFIYGVAKASDVSQSDSGTITFPMTKIRIMDIEGNEVKNYTKSGNYILETSISGSVLEMKLGKKKNGKFTSTGSKEYIRYKEEDTGTEVSLATKSTEPYGEQLYFTFPSGIYIQVEPDLILTKMLSSEDDLSLTLTKSGDQTKQYYVYASGQNAGSYSNLPEAVEAANEARGNVIDSSENVLWECIFDSYAIVAGMDDVVKVSGDGKSLAGCLSMVAAVNGKNISASSIDTSEGSVEDLLAQYSGEETLNLTGCSVDNILYYISKGSPILAKYNSKRYVLIMSYNSTNIRYLDPVTGESTMTDRTTLTETLKKAGNVFYSYLE